MVNLVIDIILLLALLLLGVPLPYCFAGALGYMVIFEDINVMSLVTWGVSQMISLTLVAGPIFILAGTLINTTKICDKLLDIANLFVGKMKSGIGFVAILTCGFLGAISGSSFTGIPPLVRLYIQRWLKWVIQKDMQRLLFVPQQFLVF